MSFTAMTDNIPVQPGVKAYNMTASGPISQGQGVYISGNNIVSASPLRDCTKRLFGLAAYTVTDGTQVAIYGPMNLCNCRMTGSITVGDFVGLNQEGYIGKGAGYYSGAIAVKGATTYAAVGQILIIGGNK